MQLGLRGKLFLVTVALITVGVVGADAYVARALEGELQARTGTELAAQAQLMADAVRASRSFEPERSDALVRALARSSHGRVTLIDPHGDVVADSAVSREQLGTLANHAARPEVREAIAHGDGAAQRDSSTLGVPLMYVAHRIDGVPGHPGPWVVRLAIAPHSLAAARAARRRFLVVGALLGLLAAGALSSLAVSLLARRVRTLTVTARAMARDLSVRTHMRERDEVGELGGVLDELAGTLASTLSSLEHERDRLEAILEAMAEGVVVTDEHGEIRLANRALREMFLAGRDLVGRPPIEALRNPDLHDVLASVRRSNEAVSREIAVTGVRPRKVIAHVAPLEHASGAVAVLFDVTDLRRLETIRRDFVANVSHELRTPIAAVRAATESLEAGALADPVAAHEFVAIIDRQSARLGQLVEDLLELSRIEARELKLSLGAVHIADTASRTLDNLALAAAGKQIALGTDIATGLPDAHADPKALEQVLSNLVDNAIKYSPAGARVTLRAAPHEGGVRISVEDTGPGIEARHLPRLFERFYRVDAGRSRAVGGTGLGLAIVKHLVDEMGGAVSVTSTTGRGSAFHVDLAAD